MFRCDFDDFHVTGVEGWWVWGLSKESATKLEKAVLITDVGESLPVLRQRRNVHQRQKEVKGRSDTATQTWECRHST